MAEPIGSCWAEDSWADATWAEGAWCDVITAHVPPQSVRVTAVQLTPPATITDVTVESATITDVTVESGN